MEGRVSYWNRAEAVFSHDVSPECEKKMYEDLEKLKNERT